MELTKGFNFHNRLQLFVPVCAYSRRSTAGLSCLESKLLMPQNATLFSHHTTLWSSPMVPRFLAVSTQRSTNKQNNHRSSGGQSQQSGRNMLTLAAL